MGLLDQLWDDIVAGPRPESGLGRLRKFSTFSSRSSSGKGTGSGSGSLIESWRTSTHTTVVLNKSSIMGNKRR
ncbi:hypothetical protein EUGRSUZ_H04561 [Eucalyptus grandis]|uniref:Uncharacterized protein n=2 Tax=Eucalyptus grandis TaxID=71139 RepID=A0ACC3JY29_EUCGR|nr:hypothetical protein EUGRSUZ_H04561 [Eucalyptus grandis]